MCLILGVSSESCLQNVLSNFKRSMVAYCIEKFIMRVVSVKREQSQRLSCWNLVTAFVSLLQTAETKRKTMACWGFYLMRDTNIYIHTYIYTYFHIYIQVHFLHTLYIVSIIKIRKYINNHAAGEVWCWFEDCILYQRLERNDYTGKRRPWILKVKREGKNYRKGPKPSVIP